MPSLNKKESLCFLSLFLHSFLSFLSFPDPSIFECLTKEPLPPECLVCALISVCVLHAIVVYFSHSRPSIAVQLFLMCMCVSQKGLVKAAPLRRFACLNKHSENVYLYKTMKPDIFY